jgi:hypothetical protein
MLRAPRCLVVQVFPCWSFLDGQKIKHPWVHKSPSSWGAEAQLVTICNPVWARKVANWGRSRTLSGRHRWKASAAISGFRPFLVPLQQTFDDPMSFSLTIKAKFQIAILRHWKWSLASKKKTQHHAQQFEVRVDIRRISMFVFCRPTNKAPIATQLLGHTRPVGHEHQSHHPRVFFQFQNLPNCLQLRDGSNLTNTTGL